MATPPRIGTNLYVKSIMTTEDVHVALQSPTGFARFAVQYSGTSPDETVFVYANGCQLTLAVNGTVYINTAADAAVPVWVAVGGASTPTVQVDNLTIVSSTATLSHTPIAILVVSSNGGVLAPGIGNDYTISGETITTLNFTSGPLLVVYFR